MTEYLKQYIKLFGSDSNVDLDIYDAPTYRSMFHMTKQIVTEKNKDWSYEKEYRLIWPNQNKNEKKELISGHYSILNNIKPVAIYIGENCTKKDKILLYSIARTKNLKLYKMGSINTTNEYCLNKTEINNGERDRLIDEHIFSAFDAYVAALKKIRE